MNLTNLSGFVVKRPSGFPVLLAANLWADFNPVFCYTDSGSTVKAVNDGDLVYTMPSQVAGPVTPIQATSADRPKYRPIGGPNNFPAIEHGDSTDNLSCVQNTLNQPFSVYYVFKWNTYTTNGIFWYIGSNVYLQSLSSGNLSINGGTTRLSVTQTVTLGGWNMLSVTFNGASTKVKVNNATTQTMSPGTTAIGSTFQIGRAGSLSQLCHVARMAIYSTAHDPDSGDGLSVRQKLNSGYKLNLL